MKGYERGLRRGRPLIMPIKKEILRLKDFLVSITDPGAAVAFGGAALMALPEGNVLLHGAVANLTLTRNTTNIVTTFTATMSLGTALTADATLNGNEVNIIPSGAFSAAVAGVTALNRRASTATENGVIFDNTAKTLNVNANFTIPDADISASSGLLLNGTVTVLYSTLDDDNV